jgi:hypothetical protein
LLRWCATILGGRTYSRIAQGFSDLGCDYRSRLDRRGVKLDWLRQFVGIGRSVFTREDLNP